MTKTLLIATAGIEAGAGLVLLVSPSLAAWLLFDRELNSSAASTVGRVAGVALLALGLACWLARNDVKSDAARGLIAAMLLYNTAAVAILAHAGLYLGLLGIGLWPGVALHIAMAAWCVASLRGKAHI